MERLSQLASELWPATGDATGFTAEVPYSDAARAAVAMAADPDAGFGTALLQVFTDQPHPDYGTGALIVPRLPVTFPDEAAPIANEFNRAEADGASATTMLGAWCPDPGDDGSVVFVSFVPSALARAGVLDNLALYSAQRATWAHDMLS